jgi:NAD(P)-dependent dehydrogenase (short-subunit alcohol dehydrogenase family)
MPDRVTILTGAGGGIGRALAKLLAHRGHSIVLVGRRRALLESTAEYCGGTVRVVPADCVDDAAASAVVDEAMDAFGRVDALVNGAGYAPLVGIAQTSEALLAEAFRINALGPAALMRRCWPHFVAQRGGRIVNLSTLGTTDPFPGYFAYAAAKSALDSMTRSAAREGAADGIVAFSINLGCVETPMLRANFSVEQIPPERAHSPAAAAAFILPFVDGARDAESGSCVPLHSP